MTKKRLDKAVIRAYRAYEKNHYADAETLCSKALQECEQYSYNRGIGGCYALLAALASKKRLLETAIELREKAFSYLKEKSDLTLAAYQLYSIALYHYEMEHYDISVQTGEASLMRFRSLDDFIGQARASSILGLAYLQKRSYDRALSHLLDAYKLKKQYSDLDDAGLEAINIAAWYLEQDDNSTAIIYLQEAIELLERYTDEIENKAPNAGRLVYSYEGYKRILVPNEKILADAYLNFGSALESLGDYTKAIEYGEKALAIKQKCNDRSGEAVALNNLGLLLLYHKDYAIAKEYLLSCLEIFTEMGQQYAAGTVQYNLGRISIATQSYQQAYTHFQEGLTSFTSIKDQKGEALIYEQLGTLAVAERKFIKAEKFLKRGLRLARMTEAKELGISLLTLLGSAHAQTGTIDEAIHQYQEALSLAEELQLKPRQFLIHYELALLYKEQGRIDRALLHFEQFHHIQATTITEESHKSLKNLQVIHQVELHKKNKEIDRLRIEMLQNRLTKIEHEFGEKERELTVATARLVGKTEFIGVIEQELKKLLKLISDRGEQADDLFNDLLKKLHGASNLESEWEALIEQFKKLHPDFMKALITKYPNLTDMEVKICTLIRSQLATRTKMIASMLQLTERTIENHRLRIRKKLSLPPNTTLDGFLIAL